MLIKEMTATECGEFLARTGFGRLGCTFDDEPYVTPIYFAYTPEHLYGFSTVGQKINWMRANPRVCLEADEVTSHFQWTSVVVRGRYHELPNIPELSSQRLTAQLELEKRILWWQTAFAAGQLREKGESTAPLLYCIHISSMTGRRAVPDPADSRFLEISVP